MNMESYICIVSIYIFYEKKGEKREEILLQVATSQKMLELKALMHRKV